MPRLNKRVDPLKEWQRAIRGTRYEQDAERMTRVLRGQETLPVGTPVEVTRADSNKAPNGSDYHVKIRASTQALASDGGIIPMDAWTSEALKRFNANPVVQFAHSYHNPPVGRSVHNEIDRTENALVQYWEFHDEDEQSRLIHTLYDRGFMRAASVGFRINAWYFPDDDEQEALQKQYGVTDEIFWVATRVELLETSAVPVPADPNALSFAQAVQNGRAHGVDLDTLMRDLPDFDFNVDVPQEDEVIEDLREVFMSSKLRTQLEKWIAERSARLAEEGIVLEVRDVEDEDSAGGSAEDSEQDEGSRSGDVDLTPVLERLDKIEARISSVEERTAALTPNPDPSGDEGSEERGDDAGDEEMVEVEVEIREGETEEEAFARTLDELLEGQNAAEGERRAAPKPRK